MSATSRRMDEMRADIERLTAERDRLQEIVDIARKATQPGVAVSVRHPYWLDLVQSLWCTDEAAEKARAK